MDGDHTIAVVAGRGQSGRRDDVGPWPSFSPWPIARFQEGYVNPCCRVAKELVGLSTSEQERLEGGGVLALTDRPCTRDDDRTAVWQRK
jgi:hypothetical protein